MFVYQGNRLRGYKEGVYHMNSDTEFTPSPRIVNTVNTSVVIGCYYNNAPCQNSFSAMVDELSFFNRQLVQDEAEKLYSSYWRPKLQRSTTPIEGLNSKDLLLLLKVSLQRSTTPTEGLNSLGL